MDNFGLAAVIISIILLIIVIVSFANPAMAAAGIGALIAAVAANNSR